MSAINTKVAGHQFIGVGVGALIFNECGEVFLAKRGPGASNEQGAWGDPGGEVQFREPLRDAICREVWEEFGMVIEVEKQLAAFDHLLDGGEEHWVSVAYLARHLAGEPHILEPDKCSACGWFTLDALPLPQTAIAQAHLAYYRSQYVPQRPAPGAVAQRHDRVLKQIW